MRHAYAVSEKWLVSAVMTMYKKLKFYTMSQEKWCYQTLVILCQILTFFKTYFQKFFHQ